MITEKEKEAIKELQEEIKQEKFDMCGFTKWFEIEKAEIILNLITKLQTDNKKLDKENQTLYESINCNDDNMLAREYQKLQKENEELKNEKEPAGEFFMSKNGVVIKVIDNREEKEGR